MPRDTLATTTKPLIGQTVAFTGDTPDRGELANKARSLGAAVCASISSGCTILVAGPNSGSKLQSARLIGLSVMDLDVFTALLRKH